MARTVPALVTQNPGNLVASALWNTGPKAITDFFTGVPMFRGYSTNTFSTNSAVAYEFPLNVSSIDTDSGHSAGSATYACQVAGWYWVEGYATFQNTTGSVCPMQGQIYVNGVPVPGLQQQQLMLNSDVGGVAASGLTYLYTGDGIKMTGIQFSGAVLNTFVGSDLAPALSLVWVHS